VRLRAGDAPLTRGMTGEIQASRANDKRDKGGWRCRPANANPSPLVLWYPAHREDDGRRIQDEFARRERLARRNPAPRARIGVNRPGRETGLCARGCGPRRFNP